MNMLDIGKLLHFFVGTGITQVQLKTRIGPVHPAARTLVDIAKSQDAEVRMQGQPGDSQHH